MPRKPKYKVVGSVKGEKGFLSQLIVLDRNYERNYIPIFKGRIKKRR